MDAVGATGEDDDSRLELGYGFERGGSVDAEGEDGEASDPAGD